MKYIDSNKIAPRRPSIMDLPTLKGKTLLRIETLRDESPRRFKWQFWLPKYGKQHILALTKDAVYDITDEIERQL